MNLSESYKKRIQELAGVYENFTPEKHNAQLRKFGIDNFEDLKGSLCPNFNYVSDKIRYFYIKNAINQEISNEAPNLKKLKDTFDGYDDLIFVKNRGQSIEYFEGFMHSCWEALFQKSEYKGLSKNKAVEKLVEKRISKIASELNLKIEKVSFKDSILYINFIKITNKEVKKSKLSLSENIKLNEGYYNLPSGTFWAWVSPDNEFYQVPKLNHKGFIMRKYKDKEFGWDYDRVFDQAIQDGWVRAIYEYFPERFKGELSLNGYSKQRVKDVLKNVFFNFVKHGNNSIYIDTENPKFSSSFSTYDSDTKQKFLDFVLTENKTYETTNESDILNKTSEEIIKYVGNDTSGFNSRQDAIKGLEYLLYNNFPDGLKNIPTLSENIKLNEDFIFHGTNNGAAYHIQKHGRMKLNAANNNEPYISFTSNIKVAQYYATMKGGSGNAVILRMKKTPDFFLSPKYEKNKGHEWVTTREIPLHELEIKTPYGWVSLESWDIIDRKVLTLSENNLPDMQSMLSKYKLRYPKDNILIVVNINKLLARHKHDEPNYAFDTRETSDYPSRVERAKKYWTDYAEDQRPISPKDGIRKDWGDMTFEAPYVSIYNSKLGFSDGRHRVIAMKELGYDDIIIEVPKDQIHQFMELK